jgi:hypothetical protein
MKTILVSFIFFANICIGQNVRIEILDSYKKFDNRVYGTFQFVDASYSRSRATLPIITTRKTLLELSIFFPQLRGRQKDYTDFSILGIADLNKMVLSGSDKKIIELFYQTIIKYRVDNDLPAIPKDQLSDLTTFIYAKSEICKHVTCKGKKL